MKEFIAGGSEERKVSFFGRLGIYRYLDMNQVTAEALEFSEIFLNKGAGSSDVRFSGGITMS